MNDNEEAKAKSRVQFGSALQRLLFVHHLNFVLSWESQSMGESAGFLTCFVLYHEMCAWLWV